LLPAVGVEGAGLDHRPGRRRRRAAQVRAARSSSAGSSLCRPG